MYGLNILAEGIEDNPANTTRFLVIGPKPGKAGGGITGRDKSSILFGTPHVPGALQRALTPFAEAGLNLMRIESFPMRDRMWEYLFFADFAGHIDEEKTRQCLHELEGRTAFLKILGSYPRGMEENPLRGKPLWSGPWKAGMERIEADDGDQAARGLDAVVRMPGSKSYTQRAMVIAALAEGESLLRDPLLSEDTLGLAGALRLLGADVRTTDAEMIIRGGGGKIVRPPHELHLGNNGTAIRLLAGMASLGEGPFVLTGDRRLCERPMKPLLDALTDLGVAIHTDGERGYPRSRSGRSSPGRQGGAPGHRQQPVRLLASDRRPVRRRGDRHCAGGPNPSLPYIALTVETMEGFGVKVLTEGAGRYVISCGQRYAASEYRIEGDASSASYFFLAAALLKGRIRVENIDPRTRQGDIGFLAILERLGSTILRGSAIWR